MTKKKKGLVSIGIFIFLFAGGWYANDFNNRTIHEKGLDWPDSVNVQQLNDDVPTTFPFQPREYIRIGDRMPRSIE
ncbi:hypothetical protein [Halalkalibacter lacteus]|uniref:hypothetical protein n=1 Tax=Halalkalibacter lacteus TaxID=3090663 RepID=UPI002FCA337A